MKKSSVSKAVILRVVLVLQTALLAVACNKSSGPDGQSEVHQEACITVTSSFFSALAAAAYVPNVISSRW